MTVVIPLVFGMNRLPVNPIWYGDLDKSPPSARYRRARRSLAMMRIEQDFDDVSPVETDTFSFDFGRLMLTGEGILSTTWTIAVDYIVPGATRDPTPSSRLVGSPGVLPASPQKTNQRVGNGCYAGNRYLLTASVTTDQGNTKVLFGSLWCRDPRASSP